MVMSSLAPMLAAALSMAFFTLLERNLMASAQSRIGPNKVSLMGALQPFADALKLLSKSLNKLIFSPKQTSYLAPLGLFSIALMMWTLPCALSASSYFPLSVLAFIFISGLTVYPLFLAGWSSKSKFSFIGATRSVAQVMSYEVSLVFLVLPLLAKSLSFSLSVMSPPNLIFCLFFFPFLIFAWVIIILTETSRTPFDFIEGESELVSGFNTEFGSSRFTLLFMAEYMLLLFMAFLTSLFIKQSYLIVSLIILLSIWTRCSYPRTRYDHMMWFGWQVLLLFLILFIPVALWV